MTKIKEAADGLKVLLTGNEALPINDNTDNPLAPDKYINTSSIANLASIEPANIIYVSDQGDDLTAVIGDKTKPYLSILTAITQIPEATEGYLVYVMAGVYDQSVIFDGNIDGLNKMINIYFQNGSKINNTDGVSLYTLSLIAYTSLTITGSLEINAPVNNVNHVIVNLESTELCSIKSIKGTAGKAFVNGTADKGVYFIQDIELSIANAVVGVTLLGNVLFSARNINIINATSGHALEINGTGRSKVNINSITSNVDGISFGQECQLYFYQITATLRGIFTSTVVSNASVLGSIISTTNNKAIQGSFNDSTFIIERATSSSSNCVDVTNFTASFYKFNYVESVTGIGIEALNCNRENYIIGVKCVGDTYGVDLLAQTAASTGITLVEIKHIIGGTHGIRIRQSDVGRIHFLVDIINSKIESTGANATDFALDINWIALTAATGFLRMKDCELIVNSASNSIRNDGGVNFDIKGYNTHSATTIDVTDITLTTITELF